MTSFIAITSSTAERGGLRGLLDLTVAEAGRADLHPLGRALDEATNALKVDVPTPPGEVVGVADTIPEARSLPANVANLGHVCGISFGVKLNFDFSSAARRSATAAGPPRGD
jgi:hypothetical protein